jgi:hypothetical protein
MDKIPFPAVIGAFLITIIYRLFLFPDASGTEVTGVFIVFALIFGAIAWLIKRRAAAKTPSPAAPPPAAAKPK